MHKSRTIKLLTFASMEFSKQQAQLNASAPCGGITECVPWTGQRLKETQFYRTHRDILDAKRGSGFWLWKPYLISAELERMRPGEFLVYYDVGRASIPHKLTQSIHPLLDWCEEFNGGVLPGAYVPEYGPSTKWTKRECFILMGCDFPEFWYHPQVQATYSIWQKSALSSNLADEWLHWCTTRGVLTDELILHSVANFPDFVDHRHDQSVITNLAIKHGVKCFGQPQEEFPGSKDINNLIDRVLRRRWAIRRRNIVRNAMRRLRSRLLGL